VTRIDLPEDFLQRMKLLLEDEFQSFLDGYELPPVIGLRINPLKINAKSFSEMAPFELTPVPWCQDGFILSGESRPGKHPYHAAGLYYLHDPSAMLAVELLNPLPGEWVLDLAAAPGGKATHIVSKMQNQGVFFANEIHPKRVWELAENLERWGALNTLITNETPQRMAETLDECFDKVLLDAPCSGEGMFRKSENARQDWSLEVVKSCAIRQQGILHQAARLVKPGGRLVYATCTFSPEENEGVVAQFLDTHKDFSLEKPPNYFSCGSGRPEWIEDESFRRFEIENTLRCWPHRGMPEGHFYAVLHKSSGSFMEKHKYQNWQHAPKDVQQLYYDFTIKSLKSMQLPGILCLERTHLYLIPEEIPALENLHVIRPGLWVGEIKGKRFEPAHALALALKASQAQRVVDFDSRDNMVLAYLHGEQIPAKANDSDGWVLITVDGFPLGWGKQAGNAIKNYYPKGLRWN